MFRVVLLAWLAGIVGCVVLYFRSGQRRYLDWAYRVLGTGLALAVVFGLVMLAIRLI